MLSDWYVKLTEQEYWSTRDNPYDILRIGSVQYITTACRLVLYYDNPNRDSSLTKADAKYCASIDYTIEINPANLAQPKRGTGPSFSDQVKNIIDKAEQLIHDPNNITHVESNKYSGEYYYLTESEFTVAGSNIGMVGCCPSGNKFRLGSEQMDSVAHMRSYITFIKVADVNLSDLMIDVRDYLKSTAKLMAQQDRQSNARVKQATSLLDSICNLSSADMATAVNNFLKRRKVSLSKLIDYLVEEADANDYVNVANTFYSLTDPDCWFLKDGEQAYSVVEEILEDLLTYDNGKPLSGYNDPDDPNVWHDFFEHDGEFGTYRGDDYNTLFDDEPVLKVSFDSDNNSIVYLRLDRADLFEILDHSYGNYSYSKDFS
jgi:hypothetical protein